MTVNRRSTHPLTFEFNSGEPGFVFEDEDFEISKAVMPSLSAYNQEKEQYRLERLARAWGYADAVVSLMSGRYKSRWNGAIMSLHDQKGQLHTRWRDLQSRMMFEGAIVGAWEQLGESWCSHGLSTR